MKEIEILVEVYEDSDIIKKKFSNFKHIGVRRTIDEYYYDPLRKELKPNKDNGLNHCLRLRNKDNIYSITYKDDVFENGKWLYSNEYETNIDNIDIVREIFSKLGLKKLLVIDNNKDTYIYNNYEIVLEDVKDLGLFMEVEYSTNEDVDVIKIKNEIQTFIDKLDIKVSKELNIGKPEMFIRKHNIKIND
jgi:predicted adenylyl cyclase CyaB